MKISWKKFFLAMGILSLLALVGAIFMTTLQVKKVEKPQEIRTKAAPATTLSFSPSTVMTGINETFTLEIRVDTGENKISAAEIYVSFDPTKLECQQISAGTFLPVVLISGTIDSTNGIASITLGSSPTEPKQGTGTLAIMSFKALNSGDTNVSFGLNTQVAAIEETGNVLTETTPSTISISSQQTPTITPTLPPDCQPVSLIISPPTPQPGEKITFDAYSSQPLVCVEITSAGGISGNLTNFRIEEVGGKIHWKWDATTGSQPGNYSVTFRGNTIDSGSGECPNRGSGSWCQATKTYTITSAPTSTPTPTPPPGKVKIKFKVKFDGVYEKKADQKVQLKVGKDKTILQEISEVFLTANNQGIYESPLLTLSSAVISGSNYHLLVKGPKHLQVRFCQNSGQYRPCTKGNITLNNGENILDFTGYPLPGGDLPPQDGVVNALDAVALVSCLSQTSSACLAKADLNFDGIVNTMDINIMNNTIYTRWEDE